MERTPSAWKFAWHATHKKLGALVVFAGAFVVQTVALPLVGGQAVDLWVAVKTAVLLAILYWVYQFGKHLWRAPIVLMAETNHVRDMAYEKLVRENELLRARIAVLEPANGAKADNLRAIIASGGEILMRRVGTQGEFDRWRMDRDLWQSRLDHFARMDLQDFDRDFLGVRSYSPLRYEHRFDEVHNAQWNDLNMKLSGLKELLDDLKRRAR